MDIKFNFANMWKLVFVVLSIIGLPVSDAVDCLQCNVFTKGTTNTCDNPRFMTGCHVCLKTMTKVKMHDRWGQYKISEAISRYCVIKSPTAIVQDVGCYYQKNNGGYTERCYCYEDNCNSSVRTSISIGALVISLVAMIIVQ